MEKYTCPKCGCIETLAINIHKEPETNVYVYDIVCKNCGYIIEKKMLPNGTFQY